MNSSKQESSHMTFLFTVVIILLVIITIVFLHNRTSTSIVPANPALSFSATPTPYSLPIKVSKSSPKFVVILQQLFRKRVELTDPTGIMETGQILAENEYFDLYAENDVLPVDAEWWQKESKEVYEYVSKRLDSTNPDRIAVIFVSPQSRICAPRGTTFFEQQPIIVIFADQETGKEQISAVFAHELGHVLVHQKYQNLNDLILDEGMATWAAGIYWDEWQGADFDFTVRTYLADGTYLPLYQNYYLDKAYDNKSSDCLLHRDILLTETACFLDYLIQKYGTDHLSMLLETQQPEQQNDHKIVYPSDFKDIYGLEFNQLEYEWLKSLLQPNQ